MTRALGRSLDPVSRLTQAVRERLPSDAPQTPGVRLRVTLGFVSIGALIGLSGRDPRPWLVLALLLVPLVHELPRALWARANGRSALVTIDAGGGRTDISGDPVPPRLAL